MASGLLCGLVSVVGAALASHLPSSLSVVQAQGDAVKIHRVALRNSVSGAWTLCAGRAPSSSDFASAKHFNMQ